MQKKTKIPRYKTDSRCYRVLEEVSAGDLFVGFLSSARSGRLMYAIARARAKERYENKQALLRLEGCGYVKLQSQQGKSVFMITKEGKIALQEIYDRALRVTKEPKKWDKAWRVVVYDFPEQNRVARNALRYILTRAHYLQLQKSVWIFPYDSSELTRLLSNDEIVCTHTVFMKVSSMSKEAEYKKHFGLE